MRRVGDNLHDVDVPEYPVLSGGAMGDVVGDGVAPRGHAAVGAEEVAIAGPELDAVALTDGFPLEGRVKAPGGKGLDDLAAGHAEEERDVGGGEVLAVAALESKHGVGAVDELDGPAGIAGRAITDL